MKIRNLDFADRFLIGALSLCGFMMICSLSALFLSSSAKANDRETFLSTSGTVGPEEIVTRQMGDGVTLITDRRTGREYIATHGSITPRLNSNCVR